MDKNITRDILFGLAVGAQHIKALARGYAKTYSHTNQQAGYCKARYYFPAAAVLAVFPKSQAQACNHENEAEHNHVL